MAPTWFSKRMEDCLVAIAIVIVLGGIAICLQPELAPTSSQRKVASIVAKLQSRDIECYSLALEYLEQPESGPFGIALAAESAAVCFEHADAIRHYKELPRDGSRWEFIASLGLARRFEILGKSSEAERQLRRALELDPNHREANSRLGHLLQVAGRTWEGAPYFYRLVRQGQCRGDELLAVAAVDRFFRSDERLEAIGLNVIPAEPMARLAVARRVLYENEQAEAERLLRQVVAAAPQIGEAQGRLGRIIFDRGDPEEFIRWRAALPREARQHPEVWYVQGLQARRLGQNEGAVRCFLETLDRHPNHLGANIQVAGCLDQLNQPELARKFARRGELLVNLESLFNIVRNDIDIDLIRKAIACLGDLGRFWEAAGWTYAIGHLQGVPAERTQTELKHWLHLAGQGVEQNCPRLNPMTGLRISDFAEPHWADPSVNQSTPSISPVDSVAWNLQDDAEQVGIDFQYYEGTTEKTRLQHIFNVVGGGIAATDFDRDGWVDLYLAQANNWRDPSVQPDYPDRLFRNLPEGRFVDVTIPAGLGDLSFTHGVAAGDFNQDGFVDLYLGNLGPNRLYLNNGDGTFTDVTDIATVAGDEWSTSAAFADFSGDGLPDLYVANYSLRNETATKECKRATGEPMACTPDLLTAEFHRFYLNQGDGSFRDVTRESGMHQPKGRGLGLVAWDYGGDSRLGLFVGNDTSPNFLFVNSGTGPDGVPRFQEEAIVRGVAFDLDGNAQACMGVAAGDADGDGLIDLYITNFFGESDTLYSQRADRLFDDTTRRFNLRDAGFWTLGFGCQFADFDGDGWEDLIATNGHVDQQSRRGDPDRTPPQLFRNRTGKTFDEIPASRLGAFFQQGYLGRGLARLDWNRDGRPDFAVSHLHGRMALVSNRTPSVGRPLIVRLAGRSGDLAAIGATVSVHVGDRRMHRFVTAGDGYLVTNERFVHFAIPDEAPSVEVEVRWPGGKTQSWTDVRPDQDILLIEGRKQPVVLQVFGGDVD